MSVLERINSPSDVKKLTGAETDELAKEIREKMIDVVSKNGGHLASNLGTVELTLALHRSFDLPDDEIVFDVGHQCYAHKLLTGRRDGFSTLRTEGGISGFTSRAESGYDAFGAGHSGTSVSAALGIANAKKLDRKKDFTVAVVGDGSMTNGMIYEALNNCSKKDLRLIIVVNDNEMSISKNVGSISNYLSSFTNTKGYIKFKSRVYHFLIKLPLVGKFFLKVSRGIKNFIKRILMSKNYFEILGLKYFGVIDGHDRQMLELVFKQAKELDSPSVVHIATKKGKGYKFAEERPDLYHSVGPFDPEKGVNENEKDSYSLYFGRLLTERAEKDENVVAITAAMGYGTGLKSFEEKFPDRFFDVGIAEEHALTFAAGLAAEGKKPVFAVYSSFLQRGYDQLIHDIAIQKLPVVVAVDRAGFVPGDGVTHQGIYDTAFLLSIPHLTVYSPSNYAELEKALDSSFKSGLPSVIRYPKGAEDPGTYPCLDLGDYTVSRLGSGKKICVVSYGRESANAYAACEKLSDGFDVTFVKLIKLSPLPCAVAEECKKSERVFIVDEGVKNGGEGEHFAAFLVENGYRGAIRVKAIEDEVRHSGSVGALYGIYGLSPEKLENEIRFFASETR